MTKYLLTKMIRTTLIALALTISTQSLAEIERFAIPGETGIKLHWWPKLAPVKGWKQDRDFSLEFGVNALAPEGASFGDAETVMYAKAIFKPRVPEVKSLEMLIENDKAQFLKNVPGVAIRDAPRLTDGDGRKLFSLTFTPKASGNWERVSYLEEGEFYLIFTVSSRTQKGLEAASVAYESMIKQYRENKSSEERQTDKK